MAPDLKRFMMLSTDSTSSMGTGLTFLNSSKPRSVHQCRCCSLTSVEYSLKTFSLPVRTAVCSLWMVWGLKRWYSPSSRHWYWPPASSTWPLTDRFGNAPLVVVEAPDVAHRDGLRGQDQRREFFGEEEVVKIAKQGFPERLGQSLLG